jgi:hypothetical protein
MFPLHAILKMIKSFKYYYFEGHEKGSKPHGTNPFGRPGHKRKNTESAFA